MRVRDEDEFGVRDWVAIAKLQQGMAKKLFGLAWVALGVP